LNLGCNEAVISQHYWCCLSKENFGESVARQFCHILRTSNAPYLPIKQLHQSPLQHKLEKADIRRCIADAEKVNYVVKEQKLKKRFRVVMINKGVKIPK
jgi:hypothetical protein